MLCCRSKYCKNKFGVTHQHRTVSYHVRRHYHVHVSHLDGYCTDASEVCTLCTFISGCTGYWEATNCGIDGRLLITVQQKGSYCRYACTASTAFFCQVLQLRMQVHHLVMDRATLSGYLSKGLLLCPFDCVSHLSRVKHIGTPANLRTTILRHNSQWTNFHNNSTFYFQIGPHFG